MSQNNILRQRISEGESCISLNVAREMLRERGYEIAPGMAADCTAKYMTGSMAGQSYPCRTHYVRQIDNKISAFNIDARRDDNFRWLQSFRQDYFCFSGGRFIEF